MFRPSMACEDEILLSEGYASFRGMEVPPSFLACKHSCIFHTEDTVYPLAFNLKKTKVLFPLL